MLSFESDYTTGAHPAILKRLMETNLESPIEEDIAQLAKLL